MSTNDHKRDRREPSLGDLNNLNSPAPRTHDDHDDGLPPIKADTDGRRPRPPSRSRTPPHRASATWRSWLWPLLAVVVVAVAALVWINQNKLRGMLPRTHLNTMLVHADQALAAGHLEGEHGKSAHALYAKVLQQDPDNGHALRGLRKVGKAELARASSAIKAGNYQQASVSIANAKRLLGGGAAVDKATEALEKARHPTKRLHAMIAKAGQALNAGRVAGDDGAAALYHQVLKVDPNNTVAQHGLERAGDMLASRARTAMRNGDVDTAASLVDQLGELLPHDGDLPTLRAHLSQTRQTTKAAIQSHVEQGQADLRQGRFTGHGGNNAQREFQAALKLDPDNAKAKAGLEQVAQALVLRANAAIDGGDAGQAKMLLDQAAKLAPDMPELAAARARLQPSNQQELPTRNLAAASSLTHPTMSPLQQVEIKHLIQRAQSAAAAGHIMLPPGDSAYDLYREVLTIDANNAAARNGLNTLSNKVVQHFKQALSGHRLDQAGNYLATLKSLEPGSVQADTLSQHLSNAWLDRAQHDVDKGNRVAAMKALQKAVKLTPDSTRAKTLRTRIHNG